MSYFLLAFFEKFRQKSQQQDEFDPIHFISLPGLSFTSAFEMNNEQMHLLSDIEMHEFFGRGMRG